MAVSTRRWPRGYDEYGLDVKIGIGGPQVNVYQLLLGNKADFVMGYDVATTNAVLS